MTKAPFGNAPVSVPVYAQYQNNRSVVLVLDFPGIREQLKLGRAFGRPSGTEACKRPYQPQYRHRTSAPELRDCPQPTEGEGGFFSTSALLPRAVTTLPRTDFCLILLFLYIVFWWWCEGKAIVAR
jgi:hypothetical protein